MIKWKLIYYQGYEPQLFNLAEDPHEQIDLAQKPNCQAIRQELTDQILTDWNPDDIQAIMAAKRADAHLLKAWAKQVQPPDVIRWNLRPEMNYLNSVKEKDFEYSEPKDCLKSTHLP